jgi:endonuclease-3
MKKTRITKIFTTFQQATPAPSTELIYKTPFELLIAVILSAQATDKMVNKTTAALFAIANTPETILALGVDKLKSYIKHIGLYNNKAYNIWQTCHLILDNFNGQVPNTHKELMSLAGVGRKTANVILNTYFKQAVIAVDTHVARVAQRLALVTVSAKRKATPDHIEQQLMQTIPQPYRQHAHHWLILHGRYTCKARNPRCSACIVSQYCPSSII